jgi:hypothetical protein
MGIFLCIVGIHRWFFWQRVAWGPYTTESQICCRCGKKRPGKRTYVVVP